MFVRRAIVAAPARAMSSKSAKPPPSSPAVTETVKDEAVDETKFENMNKDGVGYKSEKYTKHVYLNPLLTPPPRSPRTPEDFMNPSRLGHWRSLGFDYTSPIRDKWLFHEIMFAFFACGVVSAWLFAYGPDFNDRDWARREAFLRTAKREALGLPLIDPDVVDPDRIVLPTEEELVDFPNVIQ